MSRRIGSHRRSMQRDTSPHSSSPKKKKSEHCLEQNKRPPRFVAQSSQKYRKHIGHFLRRFSSSLTSHMQHSIERLTPTRKVDATDNLVPTFLDNIR
jgi:hypothetical protein